MAGQHRLTTVARYRIDAVVVIAIGCAIAAVAPFDLWFGYLTGGSALARVCLLAAIGSAGLFFAERSGLHLRASGLRFPILVPVIVAVLVALYVTVIDCFVFRAILSRDYVELFDTLPLGPRLLSFMLRAWNENIIYRLFMMSGLSWLFGVVWKAGDGRPAAGAFIAAAFLAQVINISINVTFQLPAPVTPPMLVYDLVRYVFPGALWGYLYWRHGFATAEIASVGTHPFLQPLLGALIGRA
jgi:hypothetical protein